MTNQTPKPVVLCILDGFGLGDGSKFDAVSQASTPTWDDITANYKGSTLVTHGLDVGLPEGQMGNSEVGHMNIGAGRVVMQFLTRIDLAFKDNTVKDLPNFQSLVATLKENGKTCHLMGLASDGGVHAQLDHIIGLAEALNNEGVTTKIHAFTDGRDTPPQSAYEYMSVLEQDTDLLDHVSIATVSGRYYAMDRDNRWERVSKTYDAIVSADGLNAGCVKTAIQSAYDRNENDEFIVPAVIEGYAGMEEGDAILFANFRSDRAREILQALLDPAFDGFDRAKTVNTSVATGMVDYSDHLKNFMQPLFEPEKQEKILGEVLADHGLKQLRVAETEKYPHVTFFFNNGREEPFEGEDRILVPSPKVATYDLQPEMSAPEVTEKLCAAIDTGEYDAVIVNFANPDMVGHTGDLHAVKQAIEAVDHGLRKLKDSVLAQGGVLIVAADHGNAEKMWDYETDGPHTAHTTNLVPVYIVSEDQSFDLKAGRLADLAPTMLSFLGVEKPDEMTGETLV